MSIRKGNSIIAGNPTLDSVVTTNTAQTITGNKTFSGTVQVPTSSADVGTSTEAVNVKYLYDEGYSALRSNTANIDLSNLSATGQAVIDGKANISNTVTTDTVQTITASKNLNTGGTIAYNRPIQIFMPTSTESNPTENKTREIVFLSSEGNGEWYEGSLTHSRLTTGESYTGLRAGRLVNGTYKEGALGARILVDGTTFGTAPTTPNNASANVIVTADYALNKFVTKDTAQTISGSKQFTQPSAGMSIELVADTNQQTVPAVSTQRLFAVYKNNTNTKGDGYTSWIEGYRGSEGLTSCALYARRFLESDSQEILNYIKVSVSANGIPASYTKTPPVGVTNEEIVTAGWFNSKMQVVSALPANPDPNVFYFIPE